MIKGFVVIVIVFAVIGRLVFFFFGWDSHVLFGVIACWYVIKIFF